MKYIKVIVIVFLLHQMNYAQTDVYYTFGHTIEREITTSDCINFGYEYRIDGVYCNWMTPTLISAVDPCNPIESSYTCDTLVDPINMTGDPNCSLNNVFGNPLPAFNYNMWGGTKWVPNTPILGAGIGYSPVFDYRPSGGSTFEVLESTDQSNLWLVDSAVVIKSHHYTGSCNNLGANATFFVPYDLGCKSIDSITTSYQSGDFFPCGCNMVTGIIHYSDGSTYNFDFNVIVQCSGTPTVVIQDNLQLPALNQTSGNTDVLTINNCGIVSRSNLGLLDMDSDPQNEIQDISLNGNDLSISSGSTVTLPIGTSLIDQDGDTKLEVEASTDIDEVHLSLAGTVHYEIKERNGNAIIDIQNSTNTIIGEDAGLNISTLATGSTFLGKNAGNSNTVGLQNTYLGENAGQNIVDRNENVAIGFNALGNSTNGHRSVAIGVSALRYNNNSFNVALGRIAGLASTEGSNTFIGDQSGFILTQGQGNTFVGRNSGYQMLEGDDNVAIGFDAGPVTANNIINNSVAIGRSARITSDDQIVLGNTSTMVIGGFQNWFNYSDRRIKRNIKENVIGLEFIKRLKPVSYNIDYHKLSLEINEYSFTSKDNERLKASRDIKSQRVNYGFIAQEVAKTMDELGIQFQGVHRPNQKKEMYRISYSTFVVPLVKAIQELDQKNTDLEEENKNLKLIISDVLNRLEKLERDN